MSEGVTLVLWFMGVIAVTAVVFVVWAAVSILRLVGRGIASLFRDGPQPGPGSTFVCPRTGCQALNPGSARFCRRCGHELVVAPGARRAAMW